MGNIVLQPGIQRSIEATAVASSNDLDPRQWNHLREMALGFANLWCSARAGVDAEDIAQEAMVQFLEYRQRIRQEDPANWLFVVVRRLSIRSLRRARRDASRETQTPAISSISHSIDVSRLLRTVRQCRTLTMRDRHVLCLCALGYSHSEIARRLHCGRPSVGQYVSRAMKKLSCRCGCLPR